MHNFRLYMIKDKGEDSVMGFFYISYNKVNMSLYGRQWWTDGP